MTAYQPVRPEGVPSYPRAVRLMQHYLSTAWRKAGLPWDSDNDVEAEEIVLHIINTVIEVIEVSEAIERDHGDTEELAETPAPAPRS